MTSQKNLSIAHFWFEAFNAHNLEKLLSLYDEEATHFSPKLKVKHPETNGFPKTLLIDLDPQCNLSIACLSDDTFERKVYGKKEKIKTVKSLFELYLIKLLFLNPNLY